MALTSDQLNFLVYRYLLESGFIHSAFSFGHESHITKTSLDTSQVPVGALVSFVQKGLQYCEIESHINEDGTETLCDEEFSVLRKHVCKAKRRRRVFDPLEPVDEDFGDLETPLGSSTILKGHSDLVTGVSWNPAKERQLATSSADGSAILWEVQATDTDPDEDQDMETEDAPHSSSSSSSSLRTKYLQPSKVLRPKPASASNAAAVSLVDLQWNVTGSHLAASSFDGRAFLWGSQGALRHTFRHHKAALTSVQWNTSSDLLLSASVDQMCVAWNVNSGKIKQKFDFHQAPVVDVRWRDQATFASCSTDGIICVCSMGTRAPIKRIEAHKNDVNCVRWHPTDPTILASCSDDGSVKIWNVSKGKCMQEFNEHERQVCGLSWSSGKTNLLASSSVDTTVRLWRIDDEKSKRSLSRHSHPVTLVDFSHDGRYLASGAHDRLHIWDSKNGRLLQTFKALGGINAISWSQDNEQIAIALSDSTSAVVRFDPA